MTDVSDVTGSITNIAYAGIQLGALGLALNFVGEAARGFPQDKKKKKSIYSGIDLGYDEVFTKQKKSKKKDLDLFDWGY